MISSKNTKVIDTIDITRLDQIKILKDYLGISYYNGILIKSPLRKDSNPSFSLFQDKTGVILYKDFGNGEAGNIITLIMKLNKAGKYISYKQTYRNLLNDSRMETIKPVNVDKKIIRKTKSVVVYKRAFNINDLRFWRQYYISLNTLVKFNVASVSKFIIIKEDKEVEIDTTSALCFNYKLNETAGKLYVPDGKVRFIAYGEQPIQGLREFDNDEICIITKSLKDVMVYYELGYYAIAPNSESQFIDKSLFKTIRSHFKSLYINYDSDNVGMKAMNKIISSYEIIPLIIKDNNCKDVSDYIKKNGKEQTLETVNNLLIKK